MSSEGWFQDPKDEAVIVEMAKRIVGVIGDENMRQRLIHFYGHRKGGGWMGKEAIKREGIRATLFDKEADRARA